MPDNSKMYDANPTRLPVAVEPLATVKVQPGADPDFAPSSLASEEAAVRRTMRDRQASQPPMPQPVDPRLRPIGSLILLLGAAGIFTAGLVRFLRRR